MINGISIVSVWVLDQDSAKEFYAGKLGFTVTNDLKLEGGMRWLTVRPPGNENQELLLMDPLHSMLDEAGGGDQRGGVHHLSPLYRGDRRQGLEAAAGRVMVRKIGRLLSTPPRKTAV